MDSYSNFARVYNIFMSDINYPQWADYIESLFKQYCVRPPELVADLGCGTGRFTHIMAERGYEMIGIDKSADMLSVALAEAAHPKTLYLNQDMTAFELYGTVDCIISLFDSINYILDTNDLIKIFKLVNNYLNPGGLFIFDINTRYRFESVYGANTYADTTDSAAYIWENTFDAEQSLNEYFVTLFIKQRNNLYSRYEEYHYERAHSLRELEDALTVSGLKPVKFLDAYTFNDHKPDSERIFVIARESGKYI